MDDRSEQKLGYPRQRVEGVDDQALGKGQVLAEQQHFVAQQILHPLRVARALRALSVFATDDFFPFVLDAKARSLEMGSQQRRVCAVLLLVVWHQATKMR